MSDYVMMLDWLGNPMSARQARAETKAKVRALARQVDRSGANDRPGGEASRWAANRIDDGFREQPALVLSRQDVETIVKAAKAAVARPRRKSRPAKPFANVSMREAMVRKRLRAYQDRLERFAKAGKPPSLLLAVSIRRDVARLAKLVEDRGERWQRWYDSDHPEWNPELDPDGPSCDWS